MKKIFVLLNIFLIIISNVLYAQSNGSVGINTTNPDASAVLDIVSNPSGTGTKKGVLLPRMTITQRNAIVNPAFGLIIFNTSLPCMEVNLGTPASPIWQCLSSTNTLSLDCAGTTSNGTLTSGVAASGVSSVISYTGGDGSTYAAQSVSSTGVTGLTATLAAGTLSVGSGSLTYNINGTPSGAGTASFAITVNGKSCVLTRNVSMNIPATITLSQNGRYIIASVYDQDYLPYTAPAGAATTNVQAADGLNEAVTVNMQGSITTTGVNVKIPITATGSGNLPAYSNTITIPASMTEDGISRDLTLSWAAQAYTAATTTIDATIAAVGGTLNAKKLDINAGVGNDGLGVLMGQFTYPYNNAGNTASYSVRVISGIPDRMYGLPDNNGDSTTHMMLYLPIMAEDGSIWLNNNLGADYANINHASFNPAQQATSLTDQNAYGSLFQWGRKPDGHELMTWTNATTGTAVNGTTTTLNNSPTNALFIIGGTAPYDWRTTQDDTLWATAASANNPCPDGFRLPTSSEVFNIAYTQPFNSGSKLKFTRAGLRNGSTGVVFSVSNYWSGSANGIFSNQLYYGGTYHDVFGYNRNNGISVRCRKD